MTQSASHTGQVRVPLVRRTLTGEGASAFEPVSTNSRFGFTKALPGRSVIVLVREEVAPLEAVAPELAFHSNWEGDLIMGAGNRTAIGTLVERTTRFAILLAFPDALGSAEVVGEAISTALARLPEGLRRTLTWDQGKELALHQQIMTATGAGVFFCDAHSPWQRGSNENMNGLLRDYFPKGTDLSVHTTEDLTRVAIEVNQRPRKTLGWQRPADLFHAAIAAC